MVDLLTVPLFFLLIALLAIGQVAMALHLKSTTEQFLSDLSEAVGLKGQKQQSWGVLHRAVRKGQELLGIAELEGVKIVADTKYYTKDLEDVYKSEFRQSAFRATREFEQSLAAVKQEYGQFLAKTQKESTDLVDDAMTTFTKRLEEKLTMVEEQMLTVSEQESKKAKQEVADYRQRMMTQAQDDVAEILDSVAKVVIGKSLSSGEKVDLITEAFEQAKREKFVS